MYYITYEYRYDKNSDVVNKPPWVKNVRLIRNSNYLFKKL